MYEHGKGILFKCNLGSLMVVKLTMTSATSRVERLTLMSGDVTPSQTFEKSDIYLKIS